MKAKIFTLLVLGMMFLAVPLSSAQNILTNGDFSNPASIAIFDGTYKPLKTWCTFVNNFTTDVAGGVCKYDIVDGGTNTWDIQLIQWGFPLDYGKHYRLTFEVRADAERNFGVYIGEDEGSWKNLNPNYTQHATANWETKTIDFDATQVFPLHKLSFEMGLSNIDMYFRNIVLQVIPNRAVSFEGSAVPSGAVLSTTDGIKYSTESLTVNAGTGRFVEKPSDITPSPTANWSSVDFPFGTGTQDGSLIAVAPGTYNVSFDIVTGAYNFQPILVSIIGDFSGWWGDVDMTTTDNITWTLSGFVFYSDGSLKFRDNHNWNYNFGSATGTEFPEGTGISGSPYTIFYKAGTYDITFNRTTLAYTFKCISNCPTYIGIIGSAVPPNYDLGPDVNMLTNDNITFILPDYTFTSGEAKFRKDDSWDNNWGNTTFPIGTAVKDGPGIPVTAGTYNATFNIKTGDYSFTAPSPIGIIGDALYGWNFDVDMQSTDGITYTLLNYPFANGAIKFRQDNNWNVSWGGWAFPTGIADQIYGGNIYVPAGTYNVTFNKITGEYSFVATSCPFPLLKCPDWVEVDSEPGMCGAVVDYPPVVAAASCGGEGITIKQIAGLASGSFFPSGYTWNSFELTNADGVSAFCGFVVNVRGDTEPPQIKSIPDLWPPNHKMVPIHLEFTDNCGGIISSYISDITSNEPDDGLGDGDVANDWQKIDDQNILLRAERSGKGKGRVYSFYVWAWDQSGNYFSQMVTVNVPHNQGKTEIITSTPKPGDIDYKVTLGDAAVENVPFATNVWPNPSSDGFKLEVQSSSNENAVLSIFDINGRLVSNVNAGSQQTISFGENLKAGIYMVVVRLGNNSNTFKVVKQ